MKKFYVGAFVCLTVLTFNLRVSSQPFHLVKDINITTAGGGPYSYIQYNGYTYYSVQDGGRTGLWRTDGTTAGTVKIKTVYNIRNFVILNGELLFMAGEGTNASFYDKIWKTDGSEAGTVPVSDANVGSWDTFRVPSPVAIVNNVLFFLGNDPGRGRELWKTDGTAAGTDIVKDILPGTEASPIAGFANVNGTLFISINTTSTYAPYLPLIGLWTSDGTEAGTTKISSILPENFYEVSGKALFIADRGKPTAGIYESNGTVAGTFQKHSFVPTYLARWNGKLLIGKGTSLETSDSSGNVAADRMLYNDAEHNIFQILTSGATTYFISKANSGGIYELWKTDGVTPATASGTRKVTDLGAVGTPTLLTILANGSVLFFNNDAGAGKELWKSDGTAAGTALVKDILEGPSSTVMANFFSAGNVAYFNADDGYHGKEIWKTDLTAAGTVLLRDMGFGTPGSNARNFTNFNNNVYFSALDAFSPGPFTYRGDELHKTDGTLNGTVLVKDLGPLSGSFPDNLTVHNGQLFFAATQNSWGRELFVSNGNTGSGSMVLDINPVRSASDNLTSSYPSWLTSTSNGLFFSANNGPAVNGNELWKTDGTDAGTIMVKDINAGTGNSDPSSLVNVNGIIFFAADDGTNGKELWKSDGTGAGTVMVKNIHAVGSSSPTNLINVNGIVYFSADNGADGRELWRTDGTVAGTYMIKDINTVSNSDPDRMLLLNGIVYFSANDGSGGRELWKTDGTTGGTVLVKDINSAGDSDPLSLTILNGLVYFSANNGTSGRELWRTDGTTGGTTMVMDINPGGSSNPTALTSIGFKLFFGADDGVNGSEVWATDGVTTNLIQDIQPGNVGSDPTEFIEVNGKIYTSVFTSAFGREVWVGNAALNSPLPLTLLEFKGSLVNDDSKLQWKTDNELNTKSFAVERSTDGRNFTAVGHVTAANASGVHYYNYTDANIKSLGASIFYYRLRQVDADNKFTYSRIVALTLDKQNSFVMLYPNPVRKDINLTITLAKKDRLNWQLTDNNGRVIKNGYYNLGAGSTAVVIEAGNLAAGNYFIRLNSESLTQTIQLNKQ